ncbi:4Fe-4S binding protein [Mameliella alba]|uniref:Regulator of nitric oxide reductase transcription n=1 Tax=Mameliella alba TaxID=561184 RepID=A0A0B3SSD6_9RHOB|nr:4Fe-4S binding protein [Mameliella alba]KHQ53384.1 Regulator of nitric oxide reductase transcription [Mameliella alba]
MRAILCILACLCLLTGTARAEMLSREALAERVIPPFLLGAPVNDKGVWTLENAGGQTAGYIFETEPLAPLPGFSGAAINVLVMLDLEGRFVDVQLIDHNEPIFVSGLGQAAFEQFFTQYRGHSISAPMVVGTPYGETQGSSALVYLDGVTKATASVRIAHESILAATLQVAREKMQGVSSGPPAYPDPAVDEALTWDDLLAQGLATRHRVSNAEVNAAFAGTLWEDDDPAAQDDPEGAYLDLWIVDIGPPSIARAVLDAESLAELQAFLTISDHAEPILLVETGRHGLITEEFVRNTAPDLVSAEQFGLPVALRDSDLLFSLRADLPDTLQAGTAMILRTDRRLGFDPTEPWTLHVEAVRAHGSFMPQVGSVTLSSTQSTDARFFARAEAPRSLPPWRAALRERQADLIALALGLAVLLPVLFGRQSTLAGLAGFTPVRLGILAVMTGFVGWWGQGQLSIVTVIGVIRTAWEGGSYAFLLYDPFSLLVWAAAILGFVLWGRALFCGWLCPFGAMQEFAHHLGRLLRLPEVTVSARWDSRLKRVKYLVLAGLVALIFVAPDALDTAAEVEPFKTAVTTYFIREWYYVAYAVGLLVLSAVLFKGFCRYLCPLGALMALGGLLRGRDWIARRTECGSPCQLCSVRCKYQAIPRSGQIDYAECFGCLDCVKIHDDAAQCVPLVLKARERKRAA